MRDTGPSSSSSSLGCFSGAASNERIKKRYRCGGESLGWKAVTLNLDVIRDGRIRVISERNETSVFQRGDKTCPLERAKLDENWKLSHGTLGMEEGANEREREAELVSRNYFEFVLLILSKKMIFFKSNSRGKKDEQFFSNQGIFLHTQFEQWTFWIKI